MGIVNARDLDAQMGRHIDPHSVPKHDGATHGVMEGNFLVQSDQIVTDQGHGRLGGDHVDRQQAAPDGFFGSKTVISLNEAPPLEAKLEPKNDPSAKALAEAQQKQAVPVAPSLPVLPVSAPKPVAAPRSINQLMAVLRKPGA